MPLGRNLKLILALLCLPGLATCKSRQGNASLDEAASPYRFGGACGSSGFWTQTALNQLGAIEKSVNQLQNTPACAKLRGALPELRAATAATAAPSTFSYRSGRLLSLPREISGLVSFMRSSNQSRNDALGLLADRVFEQKALEANAVGTGQTTTSLSVDAKANIQTARALDGLGLRTQGAAGAGLDHLSKFLAAVGDSSECLVGQPSVGAQAFSGILNVLGAFASAEDGVASKVGPLVGQVAKMLSNAKFNEALIKADSTEYLMSLSCLLETTSYSYCGTRDAAVLAHDAATNVAVGADALNQKDSPFFGFYILTRRIPAVSAWLRGLRYGSVPKLTTEQMQNSYLQIPDLLTVKARSVRTVYNEGVLLISSLNDAAERKNATLELVKNITEALVTNIFEDERYPDVSVPNFFTGKFPESYIPFKLIGLKTTEIPEVCSPSRGSQAITPFAWMENGGKLQSQFDNPELLLRVIGLQLDEVISSGYDLGNTFFRDHIQLDVQKDLGSASIGSIQSVLDSLRTTSDYLLALLTRCQKSPVCGYIAPSVIDTRERVEHVLKAYAAMPSQQDEAALKTLFDTIYKDFDMMLLGESFLETRLTTFVQFDIANFVHSDLMGLTPYTAQILAMADDNALQVLTQSVGTGQTKDKDLNAIWQDLERAQIVNMTSLEAIDKALGDSLEAMIQRLKIIADGGNASEAGLSRDSVIRSWQDTRILPRPSGDAFTDRFVTSFLDLAEFVPQRALIRRSKHPDLYPTGSWWRPAKRDKPLGDNEFSTFKLLWAKLCAQTLALPNAQRFAKQCDGAVLWSLFENPKQGVKFDRGLSLAYNDWTDKLDNGSTGRVPDERICAYYDNMRRNQIFWMNADSRSDSEMAAVVNGSNARQSFERHFQDLSLLNLAKSSAWRQRRIGKVEPDTTYCDKSAGSVTPESVCGAYAKIVTDMKIGTPGRVALQCVDLQGTEMYCCNGSIGSGTLPPSTDAPCFRDLSENSTFVQPLTSAPSQ